MKTMLLSFKPIWFEKIKNGEKIFEYRTSFANEEVIAYMYVSSPIKAIIGKIHLGKRIALTEWREKYKEDNEVINRINWYLEKRKYVMPILSVQMTEPISLEVLRRFSKDFVCPQMYYYLDKYPNLFDFIKSNTVNVGELQRNNFKKISADDICKVYNKEEE